MASFPVLFGAFLLVSLSFFPQGWAQECGLSNIQVTQAATGSQVQGATEYAVTIRNTCVCSQSDLLVSCAGFSSVEAVNPSLFKPVDSQNCLVNNGRPVQQSSPISFTYASQTKYSLGPVSSQLNCS